MIRTHKLALAVITVGVLVWAASPALADGGGGEADAFNLTEQALAIVVNTPAAAAAAEALERVEAALAMEAEDPTGEVELAALEEAARALEAGDLHEAEDALIAALGSSPHGVATEPGQDPSEATSVSGDDVAAHGLTERVEGGFRALSRGDTAALAAAVLMAAGGLWLAMDKRGAQR